MTQEQAIGIALCVAAAVYVIGCVSYMKLKHLSWQVQFREKAEAKGCVTTGDCVKFHRRLNLLKRTWENGNVEHHYFILTVKYKYTVDGVDYHTKVKYPYEATGYSHTTFKELRDAFAVPRQVTIYYNEANPKKAYSESELSEQEVGTKYMLLVLGLTLVMGVATYLLLDALFV